MYPRRIPIFPPSRHHERTHDASYKAMLRAEQDLAKRNVPGKHLHHGSAVFIVVIFHPRTLGAPVHTQAGGMHKTAAVLTPAGYNWTEGGQKPCLGQRPSIHASECLCGMLVSTTPCSKHQFLRVSLYHGNPLKQVFTITENRRFFVLDMWSFPEQPTGFPGPTKRYGRRSKTCCVKVLLASVGKIIAKLARKMQTLTFFQEPLGLHQGLQR